MSTRGSITILTVAALAGACTMTIELAAVRLLSPWFGTSSGVWTNVIGVILLALALGYFAGAKLSTRTRPERSLASALLASAACAAWLPGLSAPVASFFLPPGLALDEAGSLLRWGSLATALALFLPATLVLGCVPPLAVELLQRLEQRSAGDAGGRVLAASTLGSLAGTFSTTYLALPVLGLRTTFVCVGSLLAVLGVMVLWSLRSAGLPKALLLLAPVALALVASRLRSPAPADGFRVLEAVESPYQSVRVIEGREDDRLVRRLQVNEGFDSFQSVWQERPGLLAAGYYYNLFALPPWWSKGPTAWRVLVIGLGGGTAWRVIDGSLPPGMRLETHGIELDPRVVELGERWLELPHDSQRQSVLGGWDGRAGLRHLHARFDQIIVDAYANQVEIPAHLSSVEFYSEVRAALDPGGWVCVNVGAFGLGDPVVDAVGRTVAKSFGRRVLGVRVPFSRNCVLIARRDAEPIAPDAAEWVSSTGELSSLLRMLQVAGSWRWFTAADVDVLTDDLNPIDRLQRQSIAEGAQRWLEAQ